jgi:hypothetical protein
MPLLLRLLLRLLQCMVGSSKQAMQAHRQQQEGPCRTLSVPWQAFR